MLTVRQIEEYIESVAPKETAEEYDNVGLLIGDADCCVKNVLVTLDVTLNAVEEAIRNDVNLIITHHPLMFHSRKNLLPSDPEARILIKLIKHDIAVIAAHTNLDQSIYSGSACIAAALKLENIQKDVYLVTGDLPKPMKIGELECELDRILGVKTRVYTYDEKALIKKVSIVCGAGDEEYHLAMAKSAQVLITGEVRHHNAIAACMDRFILVDGTHFATERILINNFAQALQKQFGDIQCKVRFIPSEQDLFLQAD